MIQMVCHKIRMSETLFWISPYHVSISKNRLEMGKICRFYVIYRRFIRKITQDSLLDKYCTSVSQFKLLSIKTCCWLLEMVLMVRFCKIRMSETLFEFPYIKSPYRRVDWKWTKYTDFIQSTGTLGTLVEK